MTRKIKEEFMIQKNGHAENFKNFSFGTSEMNFNHLASKTEAKLASENDFNPVNTVSSFKNLGNERKLNKEKIKVLERNLMNEFNSNERI